MDEELVKKKIGKKEVDDAYARLQKYKAGKAALETSIKYLAKDLGKSEIRINAISAGPVKTLSAKGIKDFGNILELVEKKAPLHKNITIKDVGDTASFLFSDMSKAITAEIIHVDSGFSSVGV